MAERTIAWHTEARQRGSLYTHTLRVERFSSGRPGLIFIIEVTDPDGYTESNSVVVLDGWEIIRPVTEWLES